MGQRGGRGQGETQGVAVHLRAKGEARARGAHVGEGRGELL